MHSSSIGNGNNRALVYDGKIAGLYDLEETLGSGHFAVVKLARHVFTGEKVAVKVIDKTKLDEVSRAHLFQEVRCMKLVQHPNVVRLYEVIDTQTKLYLILELGDGGDLYDYIMKHDGGLSENLAIEYFRQIVRAISYCHQLHVVHRDLKPENVVFFEKLGVVKLTDFGFSNKFCPGQKLETSCGSLAYSAPEILLGDSYDAPAVDVWSLGVILYMLVCGQPPFEKANDSETLTMIMDCKYTMPAHVSAACRKLISTMLVREPEKRSTLQQIAQDPWLQQGDQQDIAPEYLPLISREQVSDEDHTLIIQKMCNGKIATKEEILDALDRNEYNHITATYFLLAERKLRQHRQEQIQKRRPDLSLPVSATSRLSPRSRIQCIKRDAPAASNTGNHLLVPTSSQLSAPRTPDTETTAGGRIRKCSIVQEEEDDEDEIPQCSGRDELTAPLNRRGSRSEGRINLSVQDRVTDTERFKKEQSQPNEVNNTQVNATNSLQPKGLGDMGGIKLVNKETNNVRARLGAAGCTKLKDRQHQQHNSTLRKVSQSAPPGGSSNPVDQNSLDIPLAAGDVNQTTILVDSAPVCIPVPIKIHKPSTTLDSSVVKLKTMPSPTRPNAIISSGARALNEIFEEGTDIGSSDSATTTPRLVSRNAHFTSNRTSNHPVSQHRRTKFHKTRTPSCSSSDASDDDSESRKKRAHKMTDFVKPIPTQRRDSHDDSSDSQDQGNAPASGGSNCASTTHMLCSSNVGTNASGDQDTSSGQSGGNNGSNTQKSNGRQKTEQQIGFRRHRAGRRRAGETRLRESQSLNRITEVQESDVPMLHSNNNVSHPLNNVPNSIHTTSATNTVKPKGFSARFFHGFIRKTEVLHSPLCDNVTISRAPAQSNPTLESDSVGDVNVTSNMMLGLELTKALRVTSDQTTSPALNTAPTKGSSATKKLKMLGKYFQVHKKLCIPLPGIFQRGRLYKAQSCGSIVRDKINPNVVLSTSASAATSNRHSILFTDKSKILRNCFGTARFLGNSDNDLGSKNGSYLKNSLLHTTIPPPTSAPATTSIDPNISNCIPIPTAIKNRRRNSSPLQQISDLSLCSSQC